MSSYWIEGSGLPEPEFAADNPVMAEAFRSFVDYAWRQKEAHDAFYAESGLLRPSATRSPLEAMIDEATGIQDSYAKAFLTWLIKNQWGEAGDQRSDQDDEP